MYRNGRLLWCFEAHNYAWSHSWKRNCSLWTKLPYSFLHWYSILRCDKPIKKVMHASFWKVLMTEIVLELCVSINLKSQIRDNRCASDLYLYKLPRRKLFIAGTYMLCFNKCTTSWTTNSNGWRLGLLNFQLWKFNFLYMLILFHFSMGLVVGATWEPFPILLIW